MNIELNDNTHILAKIEKIWRNFDKNGKEYLVIKTDKDDHNARDGKTAIFVFDLAEQWGNLSEGDSYNFEVSRSNGGNWKLKGYTKL